MVSAPIGSQGMEVPMPLRPTTHTAPNSWATHQTVGGDPRMHKAFPLGHVPFHHRDMRHVSTPPPRMNDSIFSQTPSALTPPVTTGHSPLSQTQEVTNKSNGDNKSNVLAKKPDEVEEITAEKIGSRFTARDIEEYWERHESAIGFSESDDEMYFPNYSKKETAHGKTAKNSNLLPPAASYNHGAHQDEISSKWKYNPQEYAKWDGYGSTSAPAASGSSMAGKTKTTSTMNANAPEFVNRTATALEAIGIAPTLNLDPPSGHQVYQLQEVDYSSAMPYNSQPYGTSDSGGYDQTDTRRYGEADSQLYGINNFQPYEGTSFQPYEGTNFPSYESSNHQACEGNNSQAYERVNSHAYEGTNTQAYGTTNSLSNDAAKSQAYSSTNSQPYASTSTYPYPQQSYANTQPPYGGANVRAYGTNSSYSMTGRGQSHSAYRGGYPSNPMRNQNYWDSTTYKPAPIGSSRPTTESPHRPSGDTAGQNFSGHHRRKYGRGDQMQATGGDGTRQLGKHTLGSRGHRGGKK